MGSNRRIKAQAENATKIVLGNMMEEYGFFRIIFFLIFLKIWKWAYRKELKAEKVARRIKNG